MTVKVWQGGALRTVTSIKVTVGGVLRTVRSIRVMSGGSLRTVYTAASAMTAMATDPASGSGNGSAPQVVVSGSSTCTPSGGVGPYTYSWALISYDEFDLTSVDITSPAFATTTFSATVPVENAGSAIFQCTVTDSLGATAQANLVTASFSNSSGA